MDQPSGTEQQLKLLQQLVENSFDMFWVLKMPSFELEYANKNVTERTLGYPIQDFFNDPRFWLSITFEEDRPLALAANEECLRDGAAEVRYRLRRKSGEILWVLVKVKVIKDKDGNPVRMIGSSIDITKLVSLEEEQKNQQKTLINSSKLAALGEMAGGMAHEINNPLASIVGIFSQMRTLLNKQPLPLDRLNEILGKAEANSLRIAKIIKGLRFLARDADKDPKENFLIYQSIQDTLGLCKERFAAHGIDFRIDMNIATDAIVSGRSVQISQVLINLMNNAFDALKGVNEKWIELSVLSKQNKIILSVKDSGKPISAEIAEKMMQPFFTTKDVGQGMGLGLSVSKNIIEAHGGAFYYDGSGAHTQFVIELPLQIQKQKVS